MGIPGRLLSLYYGGLNQLEGISKDMGVQLPGHKPLLAHVHGDGRRVGSRGTRAAICLVRFFMDTMTIQ